MLIHQIQEVRLEDIYVLKETNIQIVTQIRQAEIRLEFKIHLEQQLQQ